MAYLSDIEIAQSTEMRHIREIAKVAGVDEKYLDYYGKYKAKIDLSVLNDLKDKKYLYFDFAILNDDSSIKCLVEYQGIQHYDVNALHGTWKNAPQEHDIMKREYCKNNNILLIEIPYTDFDIINWDYLKNKLNL